MKRTAAVAFASALAVSGLASGLAACSGGGDDNSPSDGGVLSDGSIPVLTDGSSPWDTDAAMGSDASVNDASIPEPPADADALFGFPVPKFTDTTLEDTEIGRACQYVISVYAGIAISDTFTFN